VQGSTATFRLPSRSSMPMRTPLAPGGSVSCFLSRFDIRRVCSRSSRWCEPVMSVRPHGAPSLVPAARETAQVGPASRTLPCLTDIQCAPAVLAAVELYDRRLRFARRAHLDEAEPPRPPGVAIGDDRDRLTGPPRGEERLEVSARSFKRAAPRSSRAIALLGLNTARNVLARMEARTGC